MTSGGDSRQRMLNCSIENSSQRLPNLDPKPHHRQSQRRLRAQVFHSRLRRSLTSRSDLRLSLRSRTTVPETGIIILAPTRSLNELENSLFESDATPEPSASAAVKLSLIAGDHSLELQDGVASRKLPLVIDPAV